MPPAPLSPPREKPLHWVASAKMDCLSFPAAVVVYALHAFQKKSKQGIKTPQPDVKLIPQRLKRAPALA